MTTSIIYEMESEERKQYVSEWIKETLNIPKSMTPEEYRNELNEIIRKPDSFLNGRELDLKNYFKGEANKNFFTRDTYDRIGNNLEDERYKQEKLKEQRQSFVKTSKKDYTILTDDKGEEVKTFGFVKGEKISGRTERTVIKGKAHTRLRDNKGRFISFQND